MNRIKNSSDGDDEPFYKHERRVPVPEMKRNDIGRLVCTLGPVKSECGGDLRKSKLRLVWHEQSGDRHAACGYIEVVSHSAAVTKRAALALAEIIRQLTPNVVQSDEQRLLAQWFRKIE